MSSQGANAATLVPGYRYSVPAVRDSSDWTSMKKQLIIRAEAPATKKYPNDPWIPFGGNRRLDYLNGQFKRNAFSSCTNCPGNAFEGNGNPY
jgi:hypothetical protein